MSSGLSLSHADRGSGTLPDQGGRSNRALSQRQEPDAEVAVHLRGISKSFGFVAAVRGADLTFRKGTLTSLLGPSGCGKTTLLRMIAGLESASEGQIDIMGRSVERLPIHKRNIGFVFQNYALFPHKTVGDNIAFGLKHRGIFGKTALDKIKRALDVVRLPGIESRYPNQLSGGQQQRVALARAVVFEPDVLLLDEPLSALDANLREEMRVEIKLIQKSLAVTTILVTHDQQEALAMSDEIVVMNQGVVQQVGKPQIVYRQPRNRFVAKFLGQANVLRCKVLAPANDGSGTWLLELENGGCIAGVPGGPHPQLQPLPGLSADVVIRGTDMVAEAWNDGASKGANGLRATVLDSSFLGNDVEYLLDAGGLQLKASQRVGGVSSGAVDMMGPGALVHVRVPPHACSIIPAE